MYGYWILYTRKFMICNLSSQLQNTSAAVIFNTILTDVSSNPPKIPAISYSTAQYSIIQYGTVLNNSLVYTLIICKKKDYKIKKKFYRKIHLIKKFRYWNSIRPILFKFCTKTNRGRKKKVKIIRVEESLQVHRVL